MVQHTSDFYYIYYLFISDYVSNKHKAFIIFRFYYNQQMHN